MKSIDQNILDMRVAGLNLSAGTFGGMLGAGPRLLAFLRHFG